MQPTNPYSASRILSEPKGLATERLAPIKPIDSWKEKPEERQKQPRKKAKQEDDAGTIELDGKNPHLDIKV